MKSSRSLLVSLGLMAMAAMPLSAHELMLKSTEAHPAKDAAYQVQVVSSHVFIQPDEIEDTAALHGTLLQGDEKKDVTFKADEAAKVLTIDATGTEGTQIFGVARLGVNFAVTNKGGKGGLDVTRESLEKEGLRVKSCKRYDKYSKIVVNAKSGDDSYAALLGDDVEIQLLKNPADLKVGDYMDIKVLHHGSPESLPIFATYDGFCPEYLNTYAFYTEGDPEGVGHIKITAPGTWLVRVESTEGQGEGYDERVIRTTCSFTVNE